MGCFRKKVKYGASDDEVDYEDDGDAFGVEAEEGEVDVFDDGGTGLIDRQRGRRLLPGMSTVSTIMSTVVCSSLRCITHCFQARFSREEIPCAIERACISTDPDEILLYDATVGITRGVTRCNKPR